MSEEKKDIENPGENADTAADKIKEENVEAPAAEAETSVAKPEAPAAEPEKTPPAAGQRPQRSTFDRRKPMQEESEFIERVVRLSRVSKVVKGGKNFSFSAMVVAGDGKGQVGIGLGKSNEVVEAIKKGASQAKREMIKVNLAGSTIPHEIIGKFKSSTVLLKPAGSGTGVIAGGAVRAMCDAAGIKNILTKSLGSRNAVNVVRATIDGFEKLRLKRRGQ